MVVIILTIKLDEEKISKFVHSHNGNGLLVHSNPIHAKEFASIDEAKQWLKETRFDNEDISFMYRV